MSVINHFLFFAIIFLLIFIFGKLIEKLKIPWIFAALFLGFFLAIYNPFQELTDSNLFRFFAQLGMYFLLFIIGFELDLVKLKKLSKFIFKATFFIILFEAIFGTIFIRYVFHYDWLISFVVALSFATVGEAVLIPILDEFKLVNTKIGQTIIGIGTLDDLFEVFALIFVILLIAKQYTPLTQSIEFNFPILILSLFGLFLLAYILSKFKEKSKRFGFLNIEILFLFTIFIFFLFLGIGEYAHATPIAAILAGITIRTWAPEKRVKAIENEIRAVGYGLFAPLFFLWVGLSMDVNYLVKYFLLILAVVALSKGTKIFASWLIGRKELGVKKSILLGIGLSVRFSTSIVIVKILFINNLIGSDLYSIIVASSMIFKFIIPLLFSHLILRWVKRQHAPTRT